MKMVFDGCTVHVHVHAIGRDDGDDGDDDDDDDDETIASVIDGTHVDARKTRAELLEALRCNAELAAEVKRLDGELLRLNQRGAQLAVDLDAKSKQLADAQLWIADNSPSSLDPGHPCNLCGHPRSAHTAGGRSCMAAARGGSNFRCSCAEFRPAT